MVLPDSGIPDIVPDDATFWGDGLCFFRFSALKNKVEWQFTN
jgi:hypothetical protein